MCNRALNWKKTWIVAALLAAFLAGSGAATATEPFRPGAFDESRALLGFWKTLETDEQGAFQPLGLSLKGDGHFMLAVADAAGKVVNRVHGRYNYGSGMLKLIVDDRLYAEMRVEFAEDALNLRTGAKSTHWVKDRP